MPNSGNRRRDKEAAAGTINRELATLSKMLHLAHEHNKLQAGVPRSVAMKITGHKTEAVYQPYAIVSDANLQDAARRLAGTFTGTIRVAEVAPVS